MCPFAPFSNCSSAMRLTCCSLDQGWPVQLPRNQISDVLLLIGDRHGRVDDAEAELIDEAIVFLEDLALKNSEAVDEVLAPAHVHAGLVELQLDAPRHQTIK